MWKSLVKLATPLAKSENCLLLAENILQQQLRVTLLNHFNSHLKVIISDDFHIETQNSAEFDEERLSVKETTH
jgi:hypothetical protein